MENASKALLIAGAVLVVILLITLGIRIFSSSSGTIKSGTSIGAQVSDTSKIAAEKMKTQTTQTSPTTSGENPLGPDSNNPNSNPGNGENPSEPDSNNPNQNLGNLIKTNNYGDYIDLRKSVVGDSNLTTDDWRIIYNDKKGHIYAMLADYLPYSNKVIEDAGINKVTRFPPYCVNSNISYHNLLNKLNNTTAWQSLILESLRDRCQVRGAITKDILLGSYNEKYGTTYTYTYEPDPNNRFYFRTDPNDNSSPIDTLYMPHPNIGYKDCYGYWIDPMVEDSYGWYMYRNGCIGSNAAYDNESLGLCPVVCIPSDILATSITTSEGVTIWSINI